jgi:hypothetical protein
VIDGERPHVLRADPDQPGKAIITTGDRQFSTTVETLRLLFDQAERLRDWHPPGGWDAGPLRVTA